jgi:hypothetical protein
MKGLLRSALAASLLAACGGGDGGGGAQGGGGVGGAQTGGATGAGGATADAGTGGAPVAGPPAKLQAGLTVVSNAIPTAQGMRLVEQGFEAATAPCRPVGSTTMCLKGGIQP